jgi:small ligand-binding sensory domain FIST
MLRSGLQYSCGGRGPKLPSDESAEATLIRQALGGLAPVGFFRSGEISHTRLYGLAGVLARFPWKPVRRDGRDRETSQ